MVHLWNKALVKDLLVPGGVLLCAAAIVLPIKISPGSAAAIDFYYYAVFSAGILLAWRFHSSRILFALLTLLLAHRAIEFFSSGNQALGNSGKIALEAVAFLLPLNFIAASLMSERGLSLTAMGPRLGLLFLEAVFVAVICRPEETQAPALFHLSLLNQTLFSRTEVPQIAWIVFFITFGVLLARFLVYRKLADSGLLWALGATLLGLQAGAIGPTARAYVATGALILAGSVIENSYMLAYRDELTSLPSRRAFHDSLLGLQEPYTLAMVDIDHFKSFNDTYGHETGDHVLRMVAARLARVTGGGQAFRIGGEEFCILFRGKPVGQVVEHLELLRQTVAASTFRVRARQQATPQWPERRRPPRGKNSRTRAKQSLLPDELSVTVSIGGAEPASSSSQVEMVMRAADKALYRAKQLGRNRVQIASPARNARAAKRDIA